MVNINTFWTMFDLFVFNETKPFLNKDSKTTLSSMIFGLSELTKSWRLTIMICLLWSVWLTYGPKDMPLTNVPPLDGHCAIDQNQHWRYQKKTYTNMHAFNTASNFYISILSKLSHCHNPTCVLEHGLKSAL